MGIMNLHLHRKAYMLEFLENDVPKDVFTFSIPPESEDFDFSQRITETKTFGGSAFDDYGNDTIKITLTGSTVNEERKLIYKGLQKPPRYLTGEKEIFHLQELLDDWGKIDKVPNKKVYLYDLSKMSLIQLAMIGGGGAPTRNYWRVAIKSLKIKRAKDRPFTFNYVLEMIGFLDEKKVADPLFGSALDTLNTCQMVLEGIQNVMEYVELGAAAIDSVAGGIVKAKKAFEQIGKADWTSPVGIIKNTAKILDAPLRIISGDSSSGVYNTSKNLISAVKKVGSLGTSHKDRNQKGSTASCGDVFTVSFASNGGAYIAPKRIEYGEKLKKPADPVRAKFTFSGWYADSGLTAEYDFETEVLANTTLYGKWIQVSATVTFNSRQGSPIAAQSVTVGETADIPETPPTRNGYAFEYWCSDPAAENHYNFDSPITGDITLYAKWRTVYVANFNSNGGSAVQAQQIEVGGKIIAPMIPARENYLFVCWCSDPALTTEYDFNTIVTTNKMLYAKWTLLVNQVEFNTNGGSAVEPQMIRIGHYATRPDDPVRDGYTFIRWCSDPALTNEFLFNSTEINAPVVIYSAWTINNYTVVFNSNGGSAVPSQELNYKYKAVYPVNPTRNGYLFIRWCSDAELTSEFDFSTEITANTTLYADWLQGQDL
jgi:uncharacterized repeat protein (TIGR02543 family)